MAIGRRGQEVTDCSVLCCLKWHRHAHAHFRRWLKCMCASQLGLPDCGASDPSVCRVGTFSRSTQHVWTVELFKTAVCILLALHIILHVLCFFWGDVLLMFKEVLMGKTVRHHTASVSYVCFLTLQILPSSSRVSIAADLFEKGKSSMFISLAWLLPPCISHSFYCTDSSKSLSCRQ